MKQYKTFTKMTSLQCVTRGLNIIMKLITTILLCAALSACGGSFNTSTSNNAPTTPLNSPPRQLSVACMGDSETAGMIAGGALNSSYSYCNKLNMEFPVGNPYKFSSVTNYAVPSKDITQIYNEQLPSVLAHPADVVVIMAGVNDAYHNIPLEVFKQKYSSILSLVKAKGSVPVCLTTFPTHTPSIDTTEYDKYVLTLESQGCKVLDVKALYKESWNVNNDLHPSEQAYSDVSKALLQILYGI